MKTEKPSFILLFILCLAVLALSFAGCASMGSSNTKSMLSASGFQVRTPTTPLQKEIYAALTPYHLERATYKNKTFYVYKDAQSGVAYVGREPEYQAYCRLAVQQQISQNYQAAAMSPYWAGRWYGAYGYGYRGVYW